MQQQQLYDGSYQQTPTEQIHVSQGHKWHTATQEQYVQTAEQGQQQQGYYGGGGGAYGQGGSGDSVASPVNEHSG